MNDSRPVEREAQKPILVRILPRLLVTGFLLLTTASLYIHLWTPHPLTEADSLPGLRPLTPQEQATLAELDSAMTAEWNRAGLTPAPSASELAIVRRLGLALTGTIPSLEELRALETVAPEHQPAVWLELLFADRRHADYLSERFARVFVGADNGPFLVFRRRRMKTWLADRLMENTPYNELARTLITSEGLWTSNPATNFITYTVNQGNDQKKGPDEIQLASRTSRAFLGVRLDCMQCHDDKLHDTWKQTDFHQLAAFYGETNLSGTGVRNNTRGTYEYRLHGEPEEAQILPRPPFQPELMPEEGSLRHRLALWTTHPDNRAFARTTVNRAWALLFGKPLVEPIDDIPLTGPWPPALEIMASDLIENGYDLRRLLRLIAHSRAFQLDSRSSDPAQPLQDSHEQHWAAFPLTPLRPEQVAQSLIQSSSLKTINSSSHIVQRLRRFGQTNEFIKRYGDPGENEFDPRSSTIPQRLIVMNGKLVGEITDENPLMNAPTRIGILASRTPSAIRTAYLAVLTRLPSPEEMAHFSQLMQSAPKGDGRQQAVSDLYWTLINSTEFAWNH